jgi:hypothetical protein
MKLRLPFVQEDVWEGLVKPRIPAALPWEKLSRIRGCVSHRGGLDMMVKRKLPVPARN